MVGQPLQAGFFLRAEGGITALQRSGELQVRGLGRTDTEGGDPLGQQEAVGQLQWGERRTIADQGRTGRLQASPLVSRRNRQDPHALLKGLMGQRQTLWIQQMQMQAAKLKSPTADGRGNQCLAAMAAESHLSGMALPLGPVQQVLAIPMQGPVEVFRAVDAMDGQIVEVVAAKTLQDLQQLMLPLTQGQSRQQFAGDDPAPLGLFCLLQCMPQKIFCRAVGGCCLEMVDAGEDRCLHHLLHLLERAQGSHGPQGEQADRSSGTEWTSHPRSGSVCSGSSPSPRLRRCFTRAAGLRSSTKRLKSL